MYESGFVTGGLDSRPLRVYAFARWYRLSGMHSNVEEFIGFTEGGIITDLYAGMLVSYFDGMPVEDLLRLEKWLATRGLPPRGTPKRNHFERSAHAG